MATWLHHFGRDYRLAGISIRDPSDRLVAIAPFCISLRRLGPFKFRCLNFIGAGPSDRLDILVDPDHLSAAAECVVQTLVERNRDWDIIELSDCDADSEALKAFRGALTRSGHSGRDSVSSTCHYVTLPATFAAYMQSLGKKLRKNFGRYTRVIGEKGKLSIIEVCSPDELTAAFEELVSLHKMRFSKRGDFSSFSECDLGFHRAFLQTPFGQDLARILLLKVDDRAVGALFGYSLRGVFYFYQSGMDPAWANFSVGTVTLGHMVRSCIESGHREFDFLRGGEAYKFQWTSSVRQNLTLQYFDKRLTSQFARFATWAEALIASARRKAGAFVRRQVALVQSWTSRRPSAEPSSV